MNTFQRVLSKKLLISAAIIVFSVLALTTPSRAQFGLDPCCAIISAGLKSISSLLSSVVAKPLASIEQTQQQVSQFEREVVWPVAAINQAKQVAVQARAQLTQMTNLSHLPVASASLPATQSLERILLSRSGANVGNVAAQFRSVYGPVITSSDSPPEVRNVSDMTDAEAQAALKKALELDAIADLELNAVEQMNQQLQTAAPGSAEILAAEAATWQLRASAFSQTGMAELLRVRSVQLASQAAMLKFSATHTRSLNGITGSAVKQEAK
jgi:hypothetical protein